METIDLSKLESQETLNNTSKGNQLKWKCVFVGWNSRMFLNWNGGGSGGEEDCVYRINSNSIRSV